MGKETAYRNLRGAVAGMSDVDAAWVPIEMEPPEWFVRFPPASRNHSLRYGLVARRRLLAAEREKGPFAAAFFNHILTSLFLRDFRRRVPSVDSMDVTPIGLLEHGRAYYQSPRGSGPAFLREAKRQYARRVFSSSAHMLPYSAFTRDSLIRDYDIPAEKITVLPPGVDLSFWRGDRRGERQEGARPFTVLFVGEDFVRKGGDLIVNVARRQEFASARFHCVTGQFEGERPANLTVHEGVSRNSDRLRDLYRGADVFVLPTRADFGPTNAISEALAMGLPVIASGVGGIDEVVEDGRVGFVIPVGDSDALAQRLGQLRDDRPLRRKMAAAARKTAEERLDVAMNAARIVETMRRVTRDAERDSPADGHCR